MSAQRFSSCLAAPMDKFVDLRRLSGTGTAIGIR